jgi:RimJ/RimL family protein N-acetyltransferase
MIELVEPFPLDRTAEFHHWLGVSTISKTDEFPQCEKDFSAAMEKALPGLRTWGVLDQTDGKLIGIVIYEPFGRMGGRTYVASARRAWGRGLMEDAARLVTNELFANPQTGYLFGFVTSNNAPARAFNERVGMRLKDILPDYTVQDGKRRDMLIYEMTREAWEKLSAQ